MIHRLKYIVLREKNKLKSFVPIILVTKAMSRVGSLVPSLLLFQTVRASDVHPGESVALLHMPYQGIEYILDVLSSITFPVPTEARELVKPTKMIRQGMETGHR